MVRLLLRGVHLVREGFELHVPKLEVRDGEFFTLLGPSGCGKTTTLRIIAGFEKAEGRVFFGDEDVTDKPPYARNIGIVFQDYALFPHMTVFDNVAFGLRMRRVPEGEIRQEVGEILSLLDLEGYEKRYPEQLSGGQQQRVALARALVIKPRVLLLDEPLSNLDAKIREKLRGVIKRIQRELNITTVYVTHDQEEAMAVSDRIAVMRAGRIAQVGEPLELYYHPRSEFVARFLGASNIIELESVNGMACIGALCFETGTEGRVRIFFRPENVIVTPGETAEVVDYELLPGRMRLFLEMEGKTIIAERFINELPFKPGKVPEKVGIKVETYSILSP